MSRLKRGVARAQDERKYGSDLQSAADGQGEGAQLVHELLERGELERLQPVRLGRFRSRMDLD